MEMWGIEDPVVDLSQCPHCYAESITGSYGVMRYLCGTVLRTEGNSEQSINCISKSRQTKQRVATINGILQACDPMEREVVLDQIAAYWKGKFKFERI
jgi:hypothetical protein